jgi:hypothetical protein
MGVAQQQIATVTDHAPRFVGGMAMISYQPGLLTAQRTTTPLRLNESLALNTGATILEPSMLALLHTTLLGRLTPIPFHSGTTKHYALPAASCTTRAIQRGRPAL